MKINKKLKVGILGATGMIGRKLISLLENHPWMEVACVAASGRSAGRRFGDALNERTFYNEPISDRIKNLTIYDVEKDLKRITDSVNLVFSAISLEREKVREIENRYAGRGTPVISNNSAHRWTPDVPVIIPEINPHHAEMIEIQKKNRNWEMGFIAVKPNCSIQSYVPVLEALKNFKPEKVIVSTYQAVSGAGRTIETWPEIQDNVIPYIRGEEEKSEREPLKIWGTFKNGKLSLATRPVISSTCIRIPVSYGHMASVHIKFKKKPSHDEIIEAIINFSNPIKDLNLPYSPKQFLKYFDEEDRPQTLLDRDLEKGMAICVGRIRKDSVLDYKLIALSHNTIRGGAGGAILMAELLIKKGYIVN